MLTGTFAGTMIANASVMISFLFLHHYVLMRYVHNKSPLIQNVYRILGFGLLGILAMLFTYRVSGGFPYDNRLVPLLVLAGFAADFPEYVILSTGLLIAAGRMMLGINLGLLTCVIIMVANGIVLTIMNKKWLRNKSYSYRLYVNSLLGTGIAVVVMRWFHVLPADIQNLYFLLHAGTSIVIGTVMGMLHKEHLERMSLRDIADTDFLTGLQNRRSIDGYVEAQRELIERSQGDFSVAILDIDFFKKVNDTYGHEVGDQVIQHVAQMIKQNVRSYDRVARYGGEEFMIAFPHLNKQAASEIAERIRRSFEQYEIRLADGTTILITVSIGVASITEGDLDALKGIADERLYQAKRLGRNCIVFEG